ncbi:MAG: hypothetical protein M3092_02220, partial [Actinomycetia bacterium]|nr:hypothetical protein [Actinomycetes bacterium]
SQAERSIRAFEPRPGAWIQTPVGAIKVHKARPSNDDTDAGMVSVVGNAVLAGFSGGAIELLSVQPPGKATVEARAWMNGRRAEPLTFSADDG